MQTILHSIAYLVLEKYPSTQQVVDSRNYSCIIFRGDIDEALNLGQKNQVICNLDKSQFIVFFNRNITDTEVVIQDVIISASSSFTLLSIDIDYKCLGKFLSDCT